MKDFDVYLTRDTGFEWIRVWKDIEKGITKWHGCVYFGSGETSCLTDVGSVTNTQRTCKRKYGFIPEEGTAYNVYTKNGEIVKRRVDTQMAFSDYQDPKNGEEYILSEIKDGCIEEINEKDIDSAIKKKAIAAIRKLKKKELLHRPNPCIMNAFRWEDHKLGYKFWRDIYDAEFVNVK